MLTVRRVPLFATPFRSVSFSHQTAWSLPTLFSYPEDVYMAGPRLEPMLAPTQGKATIPQISEWQTASATLTAHSSRAVYRPSLEQFLTVTELLTPLSR